MKLKIRVPGFHSSDNKLIIIQFCQDQWVVKQTLDYTSHRSIALGQALVAQKLDSAKHQINRYPVDKYFKIQFSLRADDN